MKKDLEFTPPLDEYTYLEPETNHVSKDEFHQEPLHEMETDQGRKRWKKRLRHLLTAGVAAAVIFVPTTPNLQPEPDRPEWIEFDIEIDGVPLHFPCQESEALSSLSEKSHDIGIRTDDGTWYGVSLPIITYSDYSESLACPFNYKGITEKSTLDDCFSVLGYPDVYYINPWGSAIFIAEWYSKYDDNGSANPPMTIYQTMNRELSITITASPYEMFYPSHNEMTWASNRSRYIPFEYQKEDEILFLDKIYILDADNLLPLSVEELSGTNVIEGKTLQEGDSIQIPVPGYEAWTIAFVMKRRDEGYIHYDYAAEYVIVYPHMEKWLSEDDLGFYYHEGDISMIN